MKIKHHDIIVDPEHPFANCKLGREQYATILTSLIGSYAEGFVLTINNEWGTGKTTFVKMWQRQLIIEGFKTLYFNAWENDFENSALTALMSELSSLKEKGTANLFKKVLKNGTILTKSVLPILLKAAMAKYLDKKVVKELFEGVADSSNDMLQTQIQEYTSKKVGLKEFKISLEEFVQKSSIGKPIVFIIDELDRCRPDYAVDVLEKVKHFFGVPGIVFVLSIDKTQLGNAIRGVYGSDRLNADEYLRRFIDVEYSIPEPDTEIFCKYLFDYFELDKFFLEHNRKQYREFQYDRGSFIDFSINLFRNAKLTLRQMEKIFVHSRIALNCFHSINYLFPKPFLFLIFLRDMHFDVYNKIKAQKYNIQEFVEVFESLIPNNLEELAMNQFLYTEAELLCLYDNMKPYGKRMLYSNNEGIEVKINTSSAINVKIIDTIKTIRSDSALLENKISFLFDKIDLLDNFFPK
ncbi:MAG: P-loop NTPase fold protein [Bacteroidota bacterium]